MRTCFYCGVALQDWPKGEEYKKLKRLGMLRGKRFVTRDHKLPRSRGGDWSKANLVDACISCNSRKNNLTSAEYVHKYAKQSDFFRDYAKKATAAL